MNTLRTLCEAVIEARASGMGGAVIYGRAVALDLAINADTAGTILAALNAERDASAAEIAHARIIIDKAASALGRGWLLPDDDLAMAIERKMRALEGLEPAWAAAWKVVDAVQAAHHDDVLPRLRDLAGAAIAAALAPPELTPADPTLPTVAVPRDLVEAIVEDLRQGLAIERETGEALAELLEGGAA